MSLIHKLLEKFKTIRPKRPFLNVYQRVKLCMRWGFNVYDFLICLRKLLSFFLFCVNHLEEARKNKREIPVKVFALEGFFFSFLTVNDESFLQLCSRFMAFVVGFLFFT